MSSMKASPAFFCSEFCHSCEQSSMTNSTTDWLCLKVKRPLPSSSSSWPCDPSSVLERNGAKSTMISRRSGHTEPRAASSCCVSDASLVINDVPLNGTGNDRKTNNSQPLLHQPNPTALKFNDRHRSSKRSCQFKANYSNC